MRTRLSYLLPQMIKAERGGCGARSCGFGDLLLVGAGLPGRGGAREEAVAVDGAIPASCLPSWAAEFFFSTIVSFGYMQRRPKEFLLLIVVEAAWCRDSLGL